MLGAMFEVNQRDHMPIVVTLMRNLLFVSGFEKRGHIAHVIFERTPVFK